jgi:hypothetical protein
MGINLATPPRRHGRRRPLASAAQGHFGRLLILPEVIGVTHVT